MRCIGSHGTGASNVGRVLGRPGFMLTLAGDMAKASLVVGLAHWMECPSPVIGLVAVVLVAGNVWSVWLGFRGGKGIATGLGALLVLDYLVLIPGAITLLLIYLYSRNFTQSWVVAAVLMPAIATLLEFPAFVVLSAAAIVAIAVYAHRENIRQEWFKGDD